jgi:hypothetical protein
MKIILVFLLALQMMQMANNDVHHTAGGTTPTVCGNNGTVSGSNSGNEGVAVGTGACVPAATATVSSCVVKGLLSDVSNRHIQCAVYAGTTSAPTGSPLCTSSSTLAETAGDYTMTLSGCGTLTSGSTYYIMANADLAGDYSTQASTSALHGPFKTGVTYGTWPSSGWSNDDGTDGVRFATFYLNTLQ